MPAKRPVRNSIPRNSRAPSKIPNLNRRIGLLPDFRCDRPVGDIQKTIARKNRKLARQGRPLLGTHLIDHMFQEMGVARTGIQIGKKIFIFELINNRPTIIGTLEYLGWGASDYRFTYEAIALARLEFKSFSTADRKDVLNRAKYDLQVQARAIASNSLLQRAVAERTAKLNARNVDPNIRNNARFSIRYARTIEELDVAWEQWSQYSALRRSLTAAYRRKRKTLPHMKL